MIRAQTDRFWGSQSTDFFMAMSMPITVSISTTLMVHALRTYCHLVVSRTRQLGKM